MSISRETAVVLVDGPALVHRWYHRWSFTQKNGMVVDPKHFAVRNARYMIATAHSFDPTHLAENLLSPQVEYARALKYNKIVVCFDHGDGGRRAIFPAYKEQREVKKPKELLLIEKVAKRVFADEPKNTTLVVPDAFGDALKTLNAEADDMIATIALRNQAQMVPTVVMSHDYDLYQLINESKKCYHYDIRTKRLVSERGVVDRIGVHPRLVRDYKCLAGDASDNIPGIKGIGKVRAQALLKKYGDLDGVLTKGAQQETGAIGRALLAGKDDALMSRDVVLFRMCPKLLKLCDRFLKSPIKVT